MRTNPLGKMCSAKRRINSCWDKRIRDFLPAWRYSLMEKTTWSASKLFRRWLLIAILWVYLPKYSTTWGGPKNGCLQYTTQSLPKSFSVRSFPSWGCCFLRPATNRALKTLLSAFTGKRNLPLFFAYFHLPVGVIPHRGQCNAGGDEVRGSDPKCAK